MFRTQSNGRRKRETTPTEIIATYEIRTADYITPDTVNNALSKAYNGATCTHNCLFSSSLLVSESPTINATGKNIFVSIIITIFSLLCPRQMGQMNRVHLFSLTMAYRGTACQHDVRPHPYPQYEPELVGSAGLSLGSELETLGVHWLHNDTTKANVLFFKKENANLFEGLFFV